MGDYRDVASPLTVDMLAPLPQDCPGISVNEPLKPDEYQAAPNLTNLTVCDLPALQPGSWHDTCTGWLAQGKPPFWEN